MRDNFSFFHAVLTAILKLSEALHNGPQNLWTSSLDELAELPGHYP